MFWARGPNTMETSRIVKGEKSLGFNISEIIISGMVVQ